jgi:hypothetical protein
VRSVLELTSPIKLFANFPLPSEHSALNTGGPSFHCLYYFARCPGHNEPTHATVGDPFVPLAFAAVSTNAQTRGHNGTDCPLRCVHDGCVSCL